MNIREALKLLFFAPFAAELLAQTCPPYPIYCTTVGQPTCEPYKFEHFYFNGMDPVGAAGGTSACVYCIEGCSACINYRITIVGECNGRIVSGGGSLCCSDPGCCGGQ